MSLMIEAPASHALYFPAVTDESPAAARAWVQDAVADLTGLPVTSDLAYLAELAASELLTNVLLHAAGAALLTVTAYAGALEVAAADQRNDAVPGVCGPTGAYDEHHRGLAMLEQISAGDGVAVRPASGWGKEIAVLLPIDGSAIPYPSAGA